MAALAHFYFRSEIRIDVRNVASRPEANHEYEELKEGVWLELALALMRKKTKEDWTDNFRYVPRKLVLEGGWVQQKLFDIGWSDKSEWYEVRREIPDAFRNWEQKAKTSKKEWKWQRGMVAPPLCESKWCRGHCSLKKWESEKHKSWEHDSRRFQSPCRH